MMSDPADNRPALVPWENAPLGDDESAGALDVPDRRDGRLYLHDAGIELALEVALTTGRPLLLRGDPGSGKSSLAAFVARNLGWRYFEHVVTAATQAQDLLWRYDAVSRLSDAQAREPLVDEKYVEPGVLWWAFSSETARLYGANATSAQSSPEATDASATRDPERAVVLIDELDKADPDVPNALLVPLGSSRFRIADTGVEISRPARDADEDMSRLLVIITTNEERELPVAFVRRCIVHTLAHPSVERLLDIARLHFPEMSEDPEFEGLCEAIAETVVGVRTRASEMAVRAPSTAEYLDAVRACRSLGITVGSPMWAAVRRLTLAKDERLTMDLDSGQA
jgi:MoxR-like ATPase